MSMNITEKLVTSVLATMLLIAASSAAAQDKGCIELQTVAQTEQQHTDESGNKTTRLVAADKIVPGDVIVWTITAKNICEAPAEKIVVANPVPQHMSYVAGSAMGVGTQITYSLEGERFAASDELKVTDASGASRAARAEEYRFIRWTYTAPFAKGATAFVRYRATVN